MKARHPLRGLGWGWLLAGGVFFAVAAQAAPGIDAVTVTNNPQGGQSYTVSLQILVLMTALSLLPSLLLGMTSFTRIMVVMAILRQALGTGQTPSNQVLLGISLFLTLFTMLPVFEQVHDQAYQPYIQEKITPEQAVERAGVPFRQFMLRQTRETDLEMFVRVSGKTIDTPEETPFSLLIPAFMISELKTAFQIGFLLFLPFLIIDLVVATVLMSMGMMMLSPMVISLPFKLMLFVLVDGWSLVVETLAASFYVT
ncbi:flagellar type III secretion system pore protein FliP [Methylomagnum ishizawai]|uniref:flagellar type III secretion system pore protein FliP n=1 Tax=Methylomagnum ishizawai TaxID=1760988 RepID=UPI001C32CEA6|nr:flagellar biosynthetic protein FliP [Methylomagnum ishizawai]